MYPHTPIYQAHPAVDRGSLIVGTAQGPTGHKVTGSCKQVMATALLRTLVAFTARKHSITMVAGTGVPLSQRAPTRPPRSQGRGRGAVDGRRSLQDAVAQGLAVVQGGRAPPLPAHPKHHSHSADLALPPAERAGPKLLDRRAGVRYTLRFQISYS